VSIQKIVSRFDGHTLYECEAETLLLALQQAVKDRANLAGANLDRANLAGANLAGKPILNVVQLSGIGSCRRNTTAVILADEVQIQCGCFRGDLAAFVSQIESHHKNNPRYLAEYRAAVAWIQSCVNAVCDKKEEVTA